jgi:RNA polymerase sigma-70 factor (ECF subfamily)
LINIDEIKSGSESSFTVVFDQFHRKLYYYFLKKTKSEEIAKELVQLTFIKLWQFRHTLSENFSFESQLFNMATSTLIDYFRGQNSLRGKMMPITGNTEDLLNEVTVPEENHFENINYLHSAMESLSPVRKRIFILSRIYGYSYKEIACELSISVKTVEDHMVKALKHIRSITLQLFILFLFLFLC